MASYGVYFRCKLCCDPIDAPTSFHSLTPVMLRRTLGRSKARLLRPCLSFALCTPQRCLSETCRSTPGCYTAVRAIRMGGSRIIFANRVPTHYVRTCHASLTFCAGKRDMYLARLGKCRTTINGPIVRPHHPGDHLSGIHCVFRGENYKYFLKS